MAKFTGEKVSLSKELETLLWNVYLEKYFCMFSDVFKQKMRSEYHQTTSNDFLYEVLEHFLIPLRDKDKKKTKFLNAYKKQIKERIDLEMIEYSNYVYYDKLSTELEKLQKNTLQYLYSLICKIPFEILDRIVQGKIEELKQKAKQLFDNYATFFNTRQKVVNDLLEKIEVSNLSDIQKETLKNRTKALVNIENKLELDKEKAAIVQEIIQSKKYNSITKLKEYNFITKNRIMNERDYLNLLKNTLSYEDEFVQYNDNKKLRRKK